MQSWIAMKFTSIIEHYNVLEKFLPFGRYPSSYTFGLRREKRRRMRERKRRRRKRRRKRGRRQGAERGR